MLTIKNRCAVFLAALLPLVGCMPPGPKALLDGKRLLEHGQYAEAIERFQTASTLLATNAEAWQAWNYLGLACQYSGDLTGAERAYQRALMSNPDLVEARYNLGCLWLSQNKLEAAKSQFTTYTLRRGNSFEGFLKLGTVQLRLSEQHGPQLRSIELGAAEKALNDAAKLAPQNSECWNALGVAKLQRGHPAEAAQCFKEALKQQSDYAPSLLNLAIVSQQYLQDRKTALVKYRDYLDVKPTPANAGIVREVITQLEQAPHPAPQISAASPGNRPLEAETHNSVVPSASVAKPLDISGPQIASTAGTNIKSPQQVAMTEPQRTISASDPASPAASSDSNAPNSTRPTLLQRLFGTGKADSKTAEDAGVKAAQIQGAAVSNAAQVDWSGPRYYYHRPSKLSAGNRTAAQRWFAQGVQAQQMHRISAAQQAFREATQLDPSFFEAYYNLGRAAAESGKPTTALPAYENALSLRPDSADARYNFGLALQQANYLADAANEFERLLAANPNDAKAHLALANLLSQQLHQPANARQHYLRVLEIEPHNPQANAIRSWLAAN